MRTFNLFVACFFCLTLGQNLLAKTVTVNVSSSYTDQHEYVTITEGESIFFEAKVSDFYIFRSGDVKGQFDYDGNDITPWNRYDDIEKNYEELFSSKKLVLRLYGESNQKNGDSGGWLLKIVNLHVTVQEPPKPDLEVTDISIAGDRYINEEVTFKAEIENTGSADWDNTYSNSNDDFRVRFRLGSLNGTTICTTNYYTNDVDEGDSKLLDCDGTITSSGDKKIYAIIEKESNAPAEESTSNNNDYKYFDWNEPPKPDLEVTDISIAGDRYINEEVTFKAEIENTGSADWDNTYSNSNDDFRVRFRLGSLNGTTICTTNYYTNDVDEGDSKLLDCDGTITSSGDKKIYAIIEKESNALAEESTSNNNDYKYFDWNEPPKPDLRIREQDIEIVPSTGNTVEKGESFKIMVRIYNIGSLDSGNFSGNYYYGGLSDSSFTRFDNEQHSGISSQSNAYKSSGGSATATHVGTNYVKVCLTGTDNNDPSGNDCAIASFTVGEPPVQDLRIREQDIEIVPSTGNTVEKEESFKIRVRIYNIGSLDSGNFSGNYYYGGLSDSSFTRFDNEQHSGISSQSNAYKSSGGSATATHVGTNYVKVCLTGTDNNDPSGNDCATASFTVGDTPTPPGTITYVSSSSDSITIAWEQAMDSDGISRYYVEFKDYAPASWQECGDTEDTTITCSGLSGNGEDYKFQVRAKDNQGLYGNWTSSDYFTTKYIPSLLLSSPEQNYVKGEGKVQFDADLDGGSWIDSLSGYEIEVVFNSLTKSCSADFSGNCSVEFDTPATVGSYVAQANFAGNSAFVATSSDNVSVIVTNPAPSEIKAPTLTVVPTAVADLAYGAKLQISWTASTDAEAYVVKRVRFGPLFDVEVCNKTSEESLKCFDTGLNYEESYTYYVIASNAVGSITSAEVEITTVSEYLPNLFIAFDSEKQELLRVGEPAKFSFLITNYSAPWNGALTVTVNVDGQQVCQSSRTESLEGSNLGTGSSSTVDVECIADASYFSTAGGKSVEVVLTTNELEAPDNQDSNRKLSTLTWYDETNTILQVFLHPNQYDYQTAKWRVFGESAWNDSGDALTLPVGDYEIEFEDLDGFLPLNNIQTSLEEGAEKIIRKGYEYIVSRFKDSTDNTWLLTVVNKQGIKSPVRASKPLDVFHSPKFYKNDVLTQVDDKEILNLALKSFQNLTYAIPTGFNNQYPLGATEYNSSSHYWNVACSWNSAGCLSAKIGFDENEREELYEDAIYNALLGNNLPMFNNSYEQARNGEHEHYQTKVSSILEFGVNVAAKANGIYDDGNTALQNIVAIYKKDPNFELPEFPVVERVLSIIDHFGSASMNVYQEIILNDFLASSDYAYQQLKTMKQVVEHLRILGKLDVALDQAVSSLEDQVNNDFDSLAEVLKEKLPNVALSTVSGVMQDILRRGLTNDKLYENVSKKWVETFGTSKNSLAKTIGSNAAVIAGSVNTVYQVYAFGTEIEGGWRRLFIVNSLARAVAEYVETLDPTITVSDTALSYQYLSDDSEAKNTYALLHNFEYEVYKEIITKGNTDFADTLLQIELATLSTINSPHLYALHYSGAAISLGKNLGAASSRFFYGDAYQEFIDLFDGTVSESTEKVNTVSQWATLIQKAYQQSYEEEESSQIPNAPIIYPIADEYLDSVDVSINGNNDVIYTTDGTRPSLENGIRERESVSINIDRTITIKAIVVNNNLISEVVESTFKIDHSPRISQELSEIIIQENSQVDDINLEGVVEDEDDSVVYWFREVSNIDLLSANVSNSGNLQIELKQNRSGSTEIVIVAESGGIEIPFALTVIVEPIEIPLAPELSHLTGWYENNLTVTIIPLGTDIDRILYTTDDNVDLSNEAAAQLYTDPILISSNVTLRAVAIRDGKVSEESLANYQFSTDVDEIPTFTLTLAHSPNGRISGANCGNQDKECTVKYVADEVVKLTAVPNSGYMLHAWSDGCASTSDIASITMDADKTCSAIFIETTTTKPITAPTELNTSTSIVSITISWGEVFDASSYKVYRSDSEDGIYSLLGTVNLRVEYQDTAAFSEQNYYYKVKSCFDLYGQGSCSDLSSPVHGFREADYDQDGIPDSTDSDDDNDGISDELEEKYGLNPKDASDADLDNDGDGLTNKDEINIGSDPNDASSVITSQALTTGWNLISLIGQGTSINIYNLGYGIDIIIEASDSEWTAGWSSLLDDIELEFFNMPRVMQLESEKVYWIKVAADVAEYRLTYPNSSTVGDTTIPTDLAAGKHFIANLPEDTDAPSLFSAIDSLLVIWSYQNGSYKALAYDEHINQDLQSRSIDSLDTLQKGLGYIFITGDRHNEIDLVDQYEQLAPPSSVSATLEGDKVTIEWGGIDAADSYNLYWSNSPGAGREGSRVTHVISGYQHADVTADVTYYFWVSAVDINGESSLSQRASVTVP